MQLFLVLILLVGVWGHHSSQFFFCPQASTGTQPKSNLREGTQIFFW